MRIGIGADHGGFLMKEQLARRLAEAGHEVQIFLLGEGVSLMRDPVVNAVIPVGWPPLAETLQRTIELGIPIHV